MHCNGTSMLHAARFYLGHLDTTSAHGYVEDRSAHSKLHLEHRHERAAQVRPDKRNSNDEDRGGPQYPNGSSVIGSINYQG